MLKAKTRFHSEPLCHSEPFAFVILREHFAFSVILTLNEVKGKNLVWLSVNSATEGSVSG
jgi:hypothetical protein